MPTDRTKAGQQHVLPGAERISDAKLAQRRSDAPMRPSLPQKPCDVGLFSDAAEQPELFDTVRAAVGLALINLGMKP